MASVAWAERSSAIKTLPRLSNRRVHPLRHGRQISLIDEDGCTLIKIPVENRHELEL